MVEIALSKSYCFFAKIHHSKTNFKGRVICIVIVVRKKITILSITVIKTIFIIIKVILSLTLGKIWNKTKNILQII